MFENIKNKIKEAWNAVNGKKRSIGIIIMLAAQGLQAFFPNTMTPEQYSFLMTTGSLIGGAGIAHAGVKQYKSKKK